MMTTLHLRLSPEEASIDEMLLRIIAGRLSVNPSEISCIKKIRQSIDARGRSVIIELTVNVFISEIYTDEATLPFRSSLRDVRRSEPIVIVGAGPAGLFAALRLISLGVRPLIIERGKEVKARRRDLALLTKDRVLHPDSNYCFGEGGAGTYSDGKLYTRSTKKGDVEAVLQAFVAHGANANILYEAHPHIGTNKLPAIIEAMRKTIIDCGGHFFFETKVISLAVSDGVCKGVTIQGGGQILGRATILATGHSARDVFSFLSQQGIALEVKPFALGVRAEHPQSFVDRVQYHTEKRSEYLPPASYSLVHQVEGRGVFSFCMCPGGVIAPAMTNPHEVVVNGWSPSRRNNPFANSGIVVSVGGEDFRPYNKYGVLSAMYFQADIEQKAYLAAGSDYSAPAQRLADFIEKKTSSSLPETSYFLGVKSTDLYSVLPPEISRALREGLIAFTKKMKGYDMKEAVIVGVESRTSSPVRIPRDKQTLCHPAVEGLYPCGEGAGYAGGIMSAALDGVACANASVKKLLPLYTNHFYSL